MTGQGNKRTSTGSFAPGGADPGRDEAMAKLKTEGMSYRAIGERFGIGQPAVVMGIERAFARVPKTNTELLLKMELARLDDMWQRCMKILDAAHFTVSNGRLIYMDDQPLTDDAPILATIDRMIKVSERRAKLLGLDAPTRSRVEVVTDDMAQMLVSQMEEDIARYTASLAADGETAGQDG